MPSREERYRIFEEIKALFAERWDDGGPVAHGYGPGTERVEVRLRADQERLAGELAARYGDAVDHAVRLPSSRAPAPTVREVTIDGLDLRLEPASTTVPYGYDGRATLHLHNTGRQTLDRFAGQHLTGTVHDADDRVVGTRGWAFSLRREAPVVLGPGERATRPVWWTTASTRPELGYLLPPGRYTLRTSVRLEGPWQDVMTVVRPPDAPVIVQQRD